MKSVSVLLASLMIPHTVGGQEGPAHRLSVEVRIGAGISTGALGRTGVLENVGYVSFQEMDPVPQVGIGVVAQVAGPVSVRLTVDHGFESNARGQWYCEAFSPCPSVLILVDGRVRTWSAGADLLLRPATSLWSIEPSVSLGVVRRSHRVRWRSPVAEVPIPTAFDRAGYYARPGVSLYRPFGRVGLFTQVDAVIGAFGADRPRFIEGTVPPDPEERTQRVEVGLSVGVRIGVG